MDRIITYHFDQVVIDVRERVLVVDGRVRPVGRRVFDLLLVLVRHRRRMVSRAELMEAAWPTGVGASEMALARAISRCRKAIGDEQRAEPRIQARWGYGYGFQGEVRELREEDNAGAAGAPAEPAGQAGPMATLAVLPAGAAAGPLPAPWLHQGLADLLRHTLAQDRRLSLLPAEVAGERATGLPPPTPLAQAQRIWHRHGSAHVLALALSHDGISHRLAAQLLAADGSRRTLPVVYEQEPPALVQRLAEQVEEALFASRSVCVPLDLPDGFAVQAYLRAAQALARQQWHQACRLAEVVLDLSPGCLAAALLRLRALVRTDTDEARRLGERLLVEARARSSAEHVATLLVTLAQALAHHPDRLLRQRAQALFDEAQALAASQPPADWVIRILLAQAQATELGERRDLATALYRRAEVLALATGNRLRAAVARGNLAYMELGEGRVEAALQMQQALVRETRQLQLPAQTAFALAMQAEMQHALGDLDTACTSAGQALDQLAPLGSDDRIGASTYLAHVCSGLGLDTGDLSRLTGLLQQAGQSPCPLRPRLRVYLLLARACWRFHHSGWSAAGQALDEAVQTSRTHGLHQAVQVPLVLTMELAMAAGDAEAVVDTLNQLELLAPGCRQAPAETAVARGQAWMEHRRGDPARARRLLTPMAQSAHTTRGHALARLDAAWLASEEGAIDTAAQWLAACGHWPCGTALGGFVQARLAAARGRWPEARELARHARHRWRGHWPAEWAALEALWGPGVPRQPAALARSSCLPSQALLQTLRATEPATR